MTCRRLTIHGLVQGVGFRAWLARQARRRGLVGWVRNRPDGTVEAVVAGGQAEVDELIRWAARGPPAARVIRVDVDAASGDFTGFEQRPTG
ncbi:MAG TPA: acylphosphatase [Burkholderiaceae bacterium]|jgi:acylphosphatase|nr:acylphosphatase [Burkholderiaceae bacterium]